jgi:hypothetical protein
VTDAVIALGQKEQRVRPEAGAPRWPSAVARSASRIQINQVAAVPIQMAGCGVDVAVRPPAKSRPTMGRAHVSNRNSIDRGPITKHGPTLVRWSAIEDCRRTRPAYYA